MRFLLPILFVLAVAPKEGPAPAKVARDFERDTFAAKDSPSTAKGAMPRHESSQSTKEK